MTGWLGIALGGLQWLLGAVFGKKPPTLEDRAMTASEAYGRADEVSKANQEVLERVRQSQEARRTVDARYYDGVRDGAASLPDDGFRRD